MYEIYIYISFDFYIYWTSIDYFWVLILFLHIINIIYIIYIIHIIHIINNNKYNKNHNST